MWGLEIFAGVVLSDSYTAVDIATCAIALFGLFLVVTLPLLIAALIGVGVGYASARRRLGDDATAVRRLHGILRPLENAALVLVLLLVAVFAVFRAPPVAGGRWCSSTSPDGEYGVEIDRMATLQLWDNGMPAEITLRHRMNDGSEREAKFQVAFERVDANRDECVVTWQPDHVTIGSRAKNPDSFNDAGAVTFFRVYWDDVEFS